MPSCIAAIGECMLELSPGDGGRNPGGLPMTMNYGGDTLNTSIYLSRNGVNTRYVTALGDDSMSDWMLREWQDEGIDCSLVERMPNSVPGLYMINVAENGERSFLYWRKNSPASRLFDDEDRTKKLFASLVECSHLYLSGISLGILPENSLDRLFDSLAAYRQTGGKIIFDGNYRPNLWASALTARKVYTQMYSLTDIALPTLEDESLLFGFDHAGQVIDAVRACGVFEVVVKMGGSGCVFANEKGLEQVDAERITPVDTTAAGDSFNAAYLAARLGGSSGANACKAGHALAARVIQHRGAIIPR